MNQDPSVPQDSNLGSPSNPTESPIDGAKQLAVTQDLPSSEPGSQASFDPTLASTLVVKDSTFPTSGRPGAVPERIGKFRIEGLLGSGGMGAVYLAHQEDLGRQVALKVPSLPTDEALRRFEWEARILGQLTHPGIATLFEHGEIQTESGPRHYVAMERVEGEELVAFCRSRKLSTASIFASWWRSARRWLRLIAKESCIAISSRPTSS